MANEASRPPTTDSTVFAPGSDTLLPMKYIDTMLAVKVSSMYLKAKPNPLSRLILL